MTDSEKPILEEIREWHQDINPDIDEFPFYLSYKGRKVKALKVGATTLFLPPGVQDRRGYISKFRISGLGIAQRRLQERGYNPVFMPALIDLLTENPDSAALWDSYMLTTPSIQVHGHISEDPNVLDGFRTMYIHKQHYFCENWGHLEGGILFFCKDYLNNIRFEDQLRGYLALISHDRLAEMIDAAEKENPTEEDRQVWVLDSTVLHKWYASRANLGKYPEPEPASHGVYFLESLDGFVNRRGEKIDELYNTAINHPSIAAFCGGKSRAEKLLQRFKEHYQDRIELILKDTYLENDFAPSNPVVSFLAIQLPSGCGLHEIGAYIPGYHYQCIGIREK